MPGAGRRRRRLRPVPSDEAALQPTRDTASQAIEKRVDDLLSRMTLQEKLEQIQLLSDGQVTDADAKAGVGGVFSLVDPVKINHLQHVAVEQSRLHIPILFAYDTIHGYRTVFPIPLGDGELVRPAGRLRRRPVRRPGDRGRRHQAGLQPDGRRLARAALGPDRRGQRRGPVPRLGDGRRPGQGRPGPDYSAPDKVVASVKHLAAYGQPEGGRDYNTTDMSEQRLRNLYLPPFKAAVDAGADTAMCSFNAINGVPGCANPETETQILKQEWGFDGFIESDYTAVDELRACPPKTPTRARAGTASRPTARRPARWR